MACRKSSPSYLRRGRSANPRQIEACSWAAFSRLRARPQEGQALVDFVAADGQFGGPPRPRDCLAAQPLGLIFPAGPGQVEIVRADGLGVVVRQ